MKSAAVSIICIVTLGILFVNARPSYAQAKEFEVKAVFIYNFTQFIEWPASVFKDNSSDFIIAVVGDRPFGNYIEETVKGESVAGHRIVVRYSKSLEDVHVAHLVYIDSGISDIKRTPKYFGGKPVLTVSDHDKFISYHGMLRFYIEDNRLRMEINSELADKAGLKISSKLLRLAKLYK